MTDLANRLNELQEIQMTAARQMREALEGTEAECPQGCGPTTMMMAVRKILDQPHQDRDEGETPCPNDPRNTLDGLIYHVLAGAAEALGIQNF